MVSIGRAAVALADEDRAVNAVEIALEPVRDDLTKFVVRPPLARG
jgi:hypothetical protein